MKKVLDGKFVKTLKIRAPGLVDKEITLPKEIPVASFVTSIWLYREQLKKAGIPVTELVAISTRFPNIVILTEKHYSKHMECEFAVSNPVKASKMLDFLLDLVDKAYPPGQPRPRVVLEAKPPNFVGDNEFKYCDYIPPRLLVKNRLPIAFLDLPKPRSREKIRELQRRFLTREGVIEYLLLHCLAIRPELREHLLRKSANRLNSQKEKRLLDDVIRGKRFNNDVMALRAFYENRRNSFQKRFSG